MGHYHVQQLLGKSPESLSAARGFFSHSLMKPPTPSLSSPLVSLSVGHSTFMLRRIIIFPSQGLHTHTKTPGPSHSSILDFLYVFYSPPPLQPLIPPQIPSPLSPPLSFFLPHSFPCLSVSLWFLCVCAGWTAGGAELVGEAENGLGSQNPGSSLMGGLARLPAASVHQLRPIIWRGHIWPGLGWLGLLGTSVWSLKTPPSFLQRRDDGVLAAGKADAISQFIY